MHNGFLRVAAAVPPVRVADVKYNLDNILLMLDCLTKESVELAVFPEMSVTAYTCGDLFGNDTLIDAAREALAKLRDYSTGSPIHFIVGLPVRWNGALYNCAAFIRNGKVDLVPKTYIPNYGEFYERRWWRPLKAGVTGSVCFDEFEAEMSTDRIFMSHGVKIGIELCEDLWVPVPPSARLCMAGAQVIANTSASPDHIGKYSYLRNLIAMRSGSNICGYVYSSAGFGESTTDLAFDGKAIIAENGSILRANGRWNPADNVAIADLDIQALEHDRLRMTSYQDCAENELLEKISVDETVSGESGYTDFGQLRRYIDPHPFVPDEGNERSERCDEIINIQSSGLAKRLVAINCKTLVVGISGGLDSTLALLVAVKTFDRLGLDRKGIVGITMPGFGTTDRTHNNAVELMKALGVTAMEIPIGPAVEQHFKDIDQDPTVHDITYENSQARERTQILMDISNKLGGIVLGTGDLSELALGWATYNGDQMSMYGVNSGVPKTLVKYLVHHFAMTAPDGSEERRLLLDIIDTPISPELLPATNDGQIKQKTEDLVGPYELHDFFLYYMLRYGFATERIRMLARCAFTPQEYDDDTIEKWLKVFMRRFFSQQFKRSCMPDGPKVGSVCLSPRGDWRMPSDASSSLWR
ncbi:MAG: NAD(+) synthase [Muribaculaceae bacterium]|nr:NAD(+) synthase [Muribaculaceae bacterium]